MDEFEDDLARASASLDALEAPALATAEALQRAFAETGQSIESALTSAARTGELDFQRMAEAILSDLARIAAEAVITQSGFGQAAGQTVNMNMAFGSGSDSGSVIGAAGSIATALAQATARGGRFL